MHIAFISYEYPPDTAHGGIATYVHQAAKMMTDLGHSVEVFAASETREGRFTDGKTSVNLVSTVDRARFPKAILPVFTSRNELKAFDVIESPENGAEASELCQAHPEIARIAKLHTPHQILDKVMTAPKSLYGFFRHQLQLSRMTLGAIRRGKWPPRYTPYDPTPYTHQHLYEREAIFTSNCDLVVSPSQALANWVIDKWHIPTEQIVVVPCPYVPSADFMRIPASRSGTVIGFFGRLEQRKGITTLVEAIPEILRHQPNTRFRFVGKATYNRSTLEMFDCYINRKLKRYKKHIELAGFCPPEEIHNQYALTDICIFPSVWESFGLVCLEAMAAGRPVIASSAGGMSEILDSGNYGVLIPPNCPSSLANETLKLMQDSERRLKFALSGRARVLDTYGIEKVGIALESTFRIAIERARIRNSRRVSP